MATLTVFAKSDTSRTITTIAELRNALPATPVLPSIYALDADGQSVQIHYGDPDRTHHTVKLFSTFGVDKHTYDSAEVATTRFLELAKNAL